MLLNKNFEREIKKKKTPLQKSHSEFPSEEH